MTAFTDPLASPGVRTRAPGKADAGNAAREWQAATASAVITDASALGSIAFDGPDGADFLQGQLSNDVKKLAPGEGQWTTYNSPKGRMLATLFLSRDPDGERYVAILADELVAPVSKRLTMFVLRSKVRVAAGPADAPVLGIGGPRAADAVAAALGVTPRSGTVARTGDVLVAHWPDGRFVAVASADEAARTFDALRAHATPASAQVWSWLGVRAGVPMITAATQDLFVAQTANWDALGGLDFRKGCYTGQEIVARTQHLGRLKERLFAFRATAETPMPGTRLYGAPFGDQAAGTVVNSAPDPEGGSRFLAVAQIQAAETGAMAIGSPEGPQATREPLPYDVPEPAPPRGRVLR
jgi:folate-binding protein YgfZ